MNSSNYYSLLRDHAYRTKPAQNALQSDTPEEALMAVLTELTPEELETLCKEVYIKTFTPFYSEVISYTGAIFLETLVSINLHQLKGGEVLFLLLPLVLLYDGYRSKRRSIKKRKELEDSLISRSTLEQTADYLHFVESVYRRYKRKLTGQVYDMVINGKSREELINHKERQLRELEQLVQEVDVVSTYNPEILNQILTKLENLKNEVTSLNTPIAGIQAEFDIYIKELQKSRAAIERQIMLPNKLQQLQQILTENCIEATEGYDPTNEVIHDETAIKELIHGIVGRIQTHVRKVTAHYKTTPFSSLGTPTTPLLLKDAF